MRILPKTAKTSSAGQFTSFTVLPLFIRHKSKHPSSFVKPVDNYVTIILVRRGDIYSFLLNQFTPVRLRTISYQPDKAVYMSNVNPI